MRGNRAFPACYAPNRILFGKAAFNFVVKTNPYRRRSVMKWKTKLSKLSAALCASLLASTPVFAQSPAPAIEAPATTKAVLRVGTEVPLKLSEELTTQEKKLHVGQRFRLETAEAIMVQGVNVIPVGTPAIGEVTEVRNKGMWGKSGHLTGQLRYLTVNGRQIRLSGTFDDKGKAGGAGAVAVSAIVFVPAGFFMTGTSARLSVGTPVKGFIDEDVPLVFASTAPAPMAINAPAAAPAAGGK